MSGRDLFRIGDFAAAAKQFEHESTEKHSRREKALALCSAALCWFRAATDSAEKPQIGDEKKKFDDLMVASASAALRAAETDKTVAKGPFHLGRAFLALGAPKFARNALARALDIEPKNAQIRDAFARASQALVDRFFLNTGEEMSSKKRTRTPPGVRVSLAALAEAGAPLERGKGVFAEQAFAAGSVIFEEAPVAWSLFVGEPDNDERACSYCMRSFLRHSTLERVALLRSEARSLLEQLYSSSSSTCSRSGGSSVVCDGNDEPVHVACPGCACERYCSVACRDAANQRFHSLLCPRDGTGPSSSLRSSASGEKSAYAELLDLAHREKRTNMVVIARIFASAVRRIQKAQAAGVPLLRETGPAAEQSFEQSLLGFEWSHSMQNVDSSAAFTELIARDRLSTFGVLDTFTSNQEPFAKDEQALILIQRALLRCIPSPLDFSSRPSEEKSQELHDAILQLVSLTNLRLLNGLILRNIQRISPVSDLAAYWEANPATIPSHLAPAGFVSLVQQHGDDVLAPLCVPGGSGLFAVGNSMNHSCNPNAIIVTGKSDFRICAVALRNITPGEELTFSYIDEDQPVAVRRSELLHRYCFECTCKRCMLESPS